MTTTTYCSACSAGAEHGLHDGMLNPALAGQAPAEDQPCNDEGWCDRDSCYKDGDAFVYEVSTDTADYQAYCTCDHHGAEQKSKYPSYR